MNVNPAQNRPWVDSTLEPKDFQRLSEFIYAYSGIRMPQTKMNMLEGRLRRRIVALGMSDFREYCRYFFQEGGKDAEAVHLIDAVSTNKTDFYRESNHFDFMESVALPSLVARGIQHVRCWSSACSTGEEPYTMAMILSDYCQVQRNMDYSILATDISTEVLQTAVMGIYPKERVEPLPADLRQKYVMQPRDPRSGDIRIAPDLRSRIGFARFNLMDQTYNIGEPVHIIFCRNVMIYFDKKTQSHVLNQLCSCLAPGGFLLIGHSESIAGIPLPVQQVASTVFQKK